MVKQQCGYLNVCVYYSTSMENNYFYFWAKKVTPDLFSTHLYLYLIPGMLQIILNEFANFEFGKTWIGKDKNPHAEPPSYMYTTTHT